MDRAQSGEFAKEFAAFIEQIKSAKAARAAINPEVIAAALQRRSLREIRAELAEQMAEHDPTEAMSDDHRVWDRHRARASLIASLTTEIARAESQGATS